MIKNRKEWIFGAWSIITVSAMITIVQRYLDNELSGSIPYIFLMRILFGIATIGFFVPVMLSMRQAIDEIYSKKQKSKR